MDIRFSGRHTAILNFILIAVIVYFLAQSVSAAVKLHLAGAEVSLAPEAVTPTRLQRQHPGLHPRAYYDAIVRRDIFSLAPAPAPTPAEDENLEITLVGTSQLSSGKPFIIIESSSGDQSLYRLGETIPNVGRVLSIGSNRAVLLHNGHRVALKLATPGDEEMPQPFGLRRRVPRYFPGPRPGVPFTSYGALGSAAGVHRLSYNRFLIGRATVERNLNNMPRLFTQIRAVPNIQNGSSRGFRLSEIQRGSIFEQLGLEDGDVVTGAQGQQVNDPMKAMALLSSLRDSSSIRLKVIRNGSPVQLYYRIR